MSRAARPRDGADEPSGPLDCLKLTSYFGERDRTPRGLLADELVDLYERHGVPLGVLFRAVEGFGRLHHLHTDRLLSLSEDLPVVSVALDSPERIEGLLAQVLAIKQRGLITLERARLLSLASGLETGSASVAGLGEASKLTIYVGRHERAGGRPAFAAVCELLHRRGLAGASVLLGVDGLRDGRRSRARLLSRNSDVPVMILAVGESERIAGVLGELAQTLPSPLMTLERVRVCKRDGELLQTPHAPGGTDARGRALWQKLTVYSSHHATHEGRPLHLEIVRRLRGSTAAGATCLTGIWGFHGHRPPHGDRLLQIRRHVPVLTIAVDSPERTARSFQIIDELTCEHGLVTSEIVPAMQARSKRERLGGLELAEP
jgi:PII-like signaling protein